MQLTDWCPHRIIFYQNATRRCLLSLSKLKLPRAISPREISLSSAYPKLHLQCENGNLSISTFSKRRRVDHTKGTRRFFPLLTTSIERRCLFAGSSRGQSFVRRAAQLGELHFLLFPVFREVVPRLMVGYGDRSGRPTCLAFSFQLPIASC